MAIVEAEQRHPDVLTDLHSTVAGIGAVLGTVLTLLVEKGVLPRDDALERFTSSRKSMVEENAGPEAIQLLDLMVVRVIAAAQKGSQ